MFRHSVPTILVAVFAYTVEDVIKADPDGRIDEQKTQEGYQIHVHTSEKYKLNLTICQVIKNNY